MLIGWRRFLVDLIGLNSLAEEAGRCRILRKGTFHSTRKYKLDQMNFTKNATAFAVFIAAMEEPCQAMGKTIAYKIQNEGPVNYRSEDARNRVARNFREKEEKAAAAAELKAVEDHRARVTANLKIAMEEQAKKETNEK